MNVDYLPDAYRKDKTSNNYKLLRLNELLRDDFKTDMQAVLESSDLSKATGKTLDLYGETVNQKRGVLNDEQYRIIILLKISQTLCRGDYTSVMELLINMFKCTANDIIIKDVGNCMVEITKLPMNVLVNAGFSGSQATQLIENLLPVGVAISSANFEGTFEFGSSATDYEESKGFGNVEQTIGGYLGLSLGDTGDIVIPT